MITSAANDRIKQAVALRRRRHRLESGLILIEGATEITRALEAGVVAETLFASEDCDPSLCALVEEAGGEVAVVGGPAAERIAVRSGAPVMTAQRPHAGLAALPTPDDSQLYLVADHIEKPGNLGAMIRTADGAGASGVIATDPDLDLFSPNVIRASIGAVFTVPVATCGAPEAIAWLHTTGVSIVVAHPTATAAWYEAPLDGPVACVIGAEHAGVSAPWREAADVQVSFPMYGTGDSLNASTSAALLLYEAVRQRDR